MQQRVALVRDGLPPGKYEVERSRDLGTMGRLGRVFLDRRTVTIESGQTAVTDFVRPQGAAINGQVLGLNQGAVARAKPTYVSIRVLPPREDARTQYLLFDALVMEPGDKPLDGAFVTERLLPGRYKVRAEVFIAETAEQRSSTGIVPPAFEGETLVTVPAQGQPESIQIGLRPFQFPAQ